MIRRLFIVAATFALVAVAATPAYANPIPDGGSSIPGSGIVGAVAGAVTGDCPPKDAPDITAPDDGMAGFWMTPGPAPDAGPFDPERLWSQSGVSGFDQTTYDLGCATDPSTWANMVAAKTKTGTVNGIISWSLMLTAIGDTIQAASLNPTWIVSALGGLATRALGVISVRILAPFLGLGLIAATIALVWRGRRGDPAATFAGTFWALGVLAITAVLLASPLQPSLWAQAASATITTTINGSAGTDPVSATTNREMYAIHYQSWLRREFGSDHSEVATTYGPVLFQATRHTWADQGQSGAGLKKLDGDKASAWATTAAKVKDADPEAYAHLQGRYGNAGSAILEFAYTAVAESIRIFAAILLILVVVQLVALVIVWLIAAGWILTPAGTRFGRGLANAAWTSLWYLLSTVVAAWLWTLWCEVTLMPGTSSWQSLVLLGLGMCVFWSVLRPDRKLLSIISMGKVRGYGKTADRLLDKGLTYLVGRAAVRDGFERAERGEREEFGAAERPASRSEDHAPPPLPPAPTPRTVHEGRIHDPAPAPAPSSNVAPYDPVVIYQRPVDNHPVPRPPTPDVTPAGSDVDLYGRSAT